MPRSHFDISGCVGEREEEVRVHVFSAERNLTFLPVCSTLVAGVDLPEVPNLHGAVSLLQLLLQDSEWCIGT